MIEVLSLTAFSGDLTFLTQFEKSCDLAVDKGRIKQELEPNILHRSEIMKLDEFCFVFPLQYSLPISVDELGGIK